MKWSWRLGRIAGIDIYVHATFLLLVAFFAFQFYTERGRVSDAVQGVLFLVALFASVVLHEYGHALTARRYGVQTRDIVLLPIGGVARLERMPEEPRQELMIAIAGPIVTFVIAAALWALLHALGRPTPGGTLSTSEDFIQQLYQTNVFLGLFNLIPAFPMDGGRVLRGLLALRLPHARATEIAAQVGKVFALLFGIVGVFGLGRFYGPNPILVLIAFFIWLGASAENAVAQQRSAFGGVRVADAMITHLVTLAPEDPLQRAVNEILAGFQQDFPVVADGRVVGVLRRSDLLDALARQDGATRVGDVMQRQFDAAAPEEPLEAAVSRMQERHVATLPVVSDGRLVGVLTPENVAEFLMIHAARHTTRAAATRPF